MLRNIVKSVVSAVATYYATKLITEFLDRKPLKTRVREAKVRVVQVKDQANTKVAELKGKAKAKVDHLIEERPEA